MWPDELGLSALGVPWPHSANLEATNVVPNLCCRNVGNINEVSVACLVGSLLLDMQTIAILPKAVISPRAPRPNLKTERDNVRE